MAKLSMTGSGRPVCRYAMPSSVMNLVGEWVGRMPPALSPPRGDTAPPITWIFGETFLSSSYVRVRSARYAAGDSSCRRGRIAASRTG